jgi:hypothetical protein
MVAKESGIKSRDCGICALVDTDATTGSKSATAATLFMNDEKQIPSIIISIRQAFSLLIDRENSRVASISVIPVVESAAPTANIDTIAITTGDENPENASTGLR